MSAAVWQAQDGRVLFRDRRDAGAQLARPLQGYQALDTIVLGIPRGGVPVAAEVARALGTDMDVIVARKVVAPRAPELAIGAVTADGAQYFNEDVIAELGVAPGFLAMLAYDEKAECIRREERFRGSGQPLRVKDRIVILVDDGLATGATMRAAALSVRRREPSRLIVAVPVGSRQACACLAAEVDRVICLYQPEPFIAVGLHYERFQPTEDDEVQAILESFRADALTGTLTAHS